MSSQIIGGMQPHHYHTLPDTLNSLKVSPLKENIFLMLSKISDSEFPEFVKDILVQVEGHTLIDITDGPGDEKQDILTLNKANERCLTQCKHTINYKKAYTGDELDRMVVACMRKKCKEAIFVTNSDLTPPGKRFVTDNEYERGQTDPNNIIRVDYWNDIKIWDKIKNHPSILNKWFSGLSQTNLMRSFRFDVSVKELPLKKTGNSDTIIADMLQNMINQELLKVEADKSITGMIDNHQVVVKRNVEIDANLNVHYKDPESKTSMRHLGLLTLQITVSVDQDLDVYVPAEIKELIVKKLFEPVLPQLPDRSWWHIPTSRSLAYTYLHDINEPRIITLDKGNSFVGVCNTVYNEIDYCLLTEPDFKVIKEDNDDTDEDDEVFSFRDSDIEVVQWFENEIDPVSTYNYQVMQLYRLEELKNLQFMAVEKVDQNMLMRIRRILPSDYTAFQYNSDTLMWATPADADPEQVNKIHDKLQAMQLIPLYVRDADRDQFMANIQKDLPPAMSMFVSTVEKLNRPIKLNERVYWLKRDLQLPKSVDINLATQLLIFKYGFDENEGNFDNLMGKDQIRTHTVELRELLWDIYSFRGNRMMDIAIYRNPITLSIRYRDYEIDSSEELVRRYIQEFEASFKELEGLVNSYFKSDGVNQEIVDQ